MNIMPLLEFGLAIRIHVATVIPAALIGAALLYLPKGTSWHRFFGKVWLILMVVTSLSTFFIHEIRMIGGFSIIHLLSAFVIISAFQAIREARRHNIAAHRRHVTGMYVGGIVAAGLFTFLPGRIMNQIIFPVGQTSATDFVSLFSFVLLMSGLVLAAMALGRFAPAGK